MKKLGLFIITYTLLFASCKKTEVAPINKDLLIGGWQSKNITFNQIDGTEINDCINNATYLGLGADKSYYMNYVSGEWSLDGKKLILSPDALLAESYREYEILELTSDQLKLRISMTDVQYGSDFDQFADDEIITIVETYSRLE